jgi:hypothetical protein
MFSCRARTNSGKYRFASGGALALALLAAVPAVGAAPAKEMPRNEVKGQGQLHGRNGAFGVVYSLQNGFNFAINAARYTLEPFNGYGGATAGTDEKLVVLDFAIKNSQAADNYFGTDDLFTVVDETGQLYGARSVGLESQGSKGVPLTLRPGQGRGQVELHDPLRVAFAVPGKARIVKIMVNVGRAGHDDEKVIRYYVAGATKAEAGEDGDAKNVIAPLPDEVRDPAQPSGAVALEEGRAVSGIFFPSGAFALRLDSFFYSTQPLVDGSAAEEGKRYAVATVTARSLMDQSLTMFDVCGGDFPLHEITDADGERTKPTAYRKANRDESAEHEFRRGDEYTFRIIFTLPMDAAAKKLVLGTGGSRKWVYDIAGVK